jgi:hypothetical protein
MNKSFSTAASCARWCAVVAVVLYHVRFLLFAGYDHVHDRGLLLKLFYLVTGIGHEGFVVYMVTSGILLGGLSLQRWPRQGRMALRDVGHKAVWFYACLLPTLLLGGLLDIAGVHFLSGTRVYAYFDLFSPNFSLKNVTENLLPVQRFIVPGLGSNAMLYLLAYECWAYLACAALVLLPRHAGLLAGTAVAVTGTVLAPEFLGYLLLWAMGALAFHFRNRLVAPIGRGPAVLMLLASLLLSRLMSPHDDELPPHLVTLLQLVIDFQLGICVTLLLLASSSVQLRAGMGRQLWRIHRRLPAGGSIILASHFPFMMCVTAVLSRVLAVPIAGEPRPIRFALFAVQVVAIGLYGWLMSVVAHKLVRVWKRSSKMTVDVLVRGAVRRYQFHIGEPALQATLSFAAYGNFPMRSLHFRFYGRDGELVYEIETLQGILAPRSMLGRMRKLPLAVRAEHLARRLLHKDVSFHLDLPSSCLASPELSMSVENVGDTPVAVGMFELSTSSLAPDRLVPNQHAIEGYSDRVSVCAGESLQLFVHAPLRRFALDVIRHGACKETVFQRAEIAGKPQAYAANAYEQGANWEPTFKLNVGLNWLSGLYTASITDSSGASFDITFIVRKPRRLPAAGLAVLASTNTWQAYNEWGGASLYRYNLKDGLRKGYVFKVALQRPNPAASVEGDDGHLANAEKHVLRWLEQNGIAYDLYADIDLHDEPHLLQQYHTLLISTHSEYWTEPMYTGLENFLDGGGNLIYLSGDGLYWKAEISAQKLEVRYDARCHSASGEAGGRWRDCGRPEPKVLGMRFTRAGYKSEFCPYRVRTPAHWIFEGTGVKKGSLIGQSGLNMGGASGWEMDKIDRRDRPAGLVHLAKGTNRWRCGADMTYFTHGGGGGVFSVGSITFGGSLAVDPVLGQMMRNVLARFAGVQVNMGASELSPAVKAETEKSAQE